MEFLITYDYLEDREAHIPSAGYPVVNKMKDIKPFSIFDDNGTLCFTGFIYNSREALEQDFDKILEFMESEGGIKLLINDKEILG